MLSNNSSKEIDFSPISKSSLSDKISSPKTISTQISLDSKKNLHKNIKLGKPNKSPKIDLTNSSSNENILPNYEIQLNTSIKEGENVNEKFNTGKWSDEEQEKFIEGILEFGNEWKKVQQIIKTRSSTQARSHGQKFFLRIKKLMKNKEEKKGFENILSQVLPKKFIKKLNGNQKEKLLSAISSNIKCEENCNFSDEFDFDFEDNDSIKDKKFGNDSNIIIKNNKINFDFNYLNFNDDFYFPNNDKVFIGHKTKFKNNILCKEKNYKTKKNEPHKPLFDFNFYNEENNYFNNLGLGDNEFTVTKNACNFDNFRKNSINSNSANIKQENKGGCIINNIINVTILNQEINNNICHPDLYCNDKDDSFNKEENLFYFDDLKNKDDFGISNKNEIKCLKDDFNDVNCKNKYNDENEIDNEKDPFQLNFNNFSDEKILNNENERQFTIQENDYFGIE